MILALIVALLLGMLSGTITGLAPGIHINLIAAILLASLSSFAGIPLIALAVFIVAMSITHTFLDFIPSVFIGAPEEDTFLSILPGHELLQEGHGYKAVVLTLYGSLFALLIILIFTPLFILFLPSLYKTIKFIIPFVLIFISFYLIFREDNFLLSLVVFLLAGFLGIAAFNLPIKEPLLPLLSGLFGISSLIISLKSSKNPKKQSLLPLKEIKLSKSEFKKASLAALISAPLCSFLPGISSGHAATIGSEIIPQERKGFLFLVGSINTVIMALSFITVYAIGKARSGTAAAIQDILHQISLQHLIIILGTIIISGILAFFLGINLAKFFALSLNKINYKKLTLGIIIILTIINLIFSSWLGFIVLITSTSLGIFCILSNSRRINLMGSLIIPTIVYYLMN
ncbi:MAG: tripartite tricarboxylate transporter permease [Nanoarchaeota archaeon]